MFLLEGGSINAADSGGNTPLHFFLLAPEKSQTQKSTANRCHLAYYDVPFLADSGVNVFAVNKEGETALHLVARRGPSYRAASGHDEGLFRALMAKGDKRWRSASDVASACSKKDIMTILGSGELLERVLTISFG
ncbi:hypothetical protein B0T26DRAFT_446956 [Lasiosphaeria miniovina]|uniref:Ankyrin repeat protein n=1 Tax=Lasiosphaeria miniovina TaxID=1954250 RepID=A0AA39ZZ58_9PEZI|nr:uncharacterized protein B0T26DRAFT_446956 [Lasiosphaeria miniovina]KAK0706300.1 hypothetical protein B0T26DRAFT_446956 [Lasiosphaeria miniovina]